VFSFSTSDENLLKNLEMFDRLALRFNGRIHFIKDAIGPSEICCWRFYGNAKKFAEVCCTSIVYATDRKHTKVLILVIYEISFLTWELPEFNGIHV